MVSNIPITTAMLVYPCEACKSGPRLIAVPGIKLANDFDAPLEAFAGYRPNRLAGE
jgi:hypothetical protein